MYLYQVYKKKKVKFLLTPTLTLYFHGYFSACRKGLKSCDLYKEKKTFEILKKKKTLSKFLL